MVFLAMGKARPGTAVAALLAAALALAVQNGPAAAQTVAGRPSPALAPDYALTDLNPRSPTYSVRVGPSARLPAATLPHVREFYSQLPAADDLRQEAELGNRWLEICSGLPLESGVQVRAIKPLPSLGHTGTALVIANGPRCPVPIVFAAVVFLYLGGQRF